MKRLLIQLPVTLVCMLICMSRLPAQLPEDFYAQPMPLPEAVEFPVGLSPDSSGRLYLWDKAGTVWVRDTNGIWDDTPLVDIREEVSNWYDVGLMGFALDYQFEENGYFYLLYALDLHHYYHFGTPQYHPDSSVTESATVGRVVRYQADPDGPFPRLQPGSRHVLLGADLADGIPILYGTHAIGSLVHSPDSTLLVSCGEVTSWQGWDTGGDEYGTLVSEGLAKGIITAAEDVGSYRAQFRGSLNGKILRIDSRTGAGLPSNPFYQSANPRSAPSRIWTLGLRNPYRMTLVPGTSGHSPAEGQPGHLLVGDVGSVKFEELNRVREGGQNFGWPVTEGFGTVWEFLNQPAPLNALAPLPSTCGPGYLDFRQTFVRANRLQLVEKPHPCLPDTSWADTSLLSLETPPLIAWSSLWNAPTRAHVPGYDEEDQLIGRIMEEAGVAGESFLGYSSLAGAFYMGSRFPEPYRDCFFLADYFGWIRALRFDEEGQVAQVLPFHEEADRIIHLTYAPREEALYYLDVHGQLFRITYGGEVPPIARIQADTVYGGSVLAVQFDGRASTHPKHPIAAYHWDFGKGDTSNLAQPSHTFRASGPEAETFEVTLTVTDTAGNTAQAVRQIYLNNSPPEVTITSVQEGAQYPISTTVLLPLIAEVSDAEHSNEELSYDWRVFLHHNDHFHPQPSIKKPQAQLLTDPYGCGAETFWYRIQLTVTDPMGLSTRVSREIFPYCGSPFVEWLELSGRRHSDHVLLEWENTLLDGVVRFELERSQDMIHFYPAGNIPVNEPGQLSFRYRDYAFPHPAALYRVKAVHRNGAFAYSNLFEVSNRLPEIRFFPNPTSGPLWLRLVNPDAGPMRVRFYDSSGTYLSEVQLDPQAGMDEERAIQLPRASSGVIIYVVEAEGAILQAGRILSVR